jgi:hypothetical protein
MQIPEQVKEELHGRMCELGQPSLWLQQQSRGSTCSWLVRLWMLLRMLNHHRMRCCGASRRISLFECTMAQMLPFTNANANTNTEATPKTALAHPARQRASTPRIPRGDRRPGARLCPALTQRRDEHLRLAHGASGALGPDVAGSSRRKGTMRSAGLSRSNQGP